MTALAILFGALVTVVTSLAIGRMILRRIPVELFRIEEDAIGFVAGAGVLSFVLFLLSTLHWANKTVLLMVALTAIGAAVYTGAHRNTQPRFPALPRFWAILFWLGFTVFTVLYFFSSMAPEFSPDGTAYHLSFVAQYARAHGFVHIPTNLYAQLSQGIELLFLMAFSFGRHSAAAMVHYAFLLALVAAVASYGRRVGHPVAGLAGALLVYASPVVGKDGTCAYIDVAVAAILFTTFYAVQLWDEQRSTGLLMLIGVLAGFGYAAKYTAIVGLAYAAGFVVWRARRLRAILIVVGCATVLIVPWVVKDIVWAANPVAPLFNSLFPNPYVHISFEQAWTANLRNYALPNLWSIPLEVAVRGGTLCGLVGPVFLLVPLALAGLRLRTGRRVLAAGAIFALPYALNIGTRFLIPALPFFAFTLALALTEMPLILVTLLVAHCVLSWPSVTAQYAAPRAWLLFRIPFKQALRIESQDSWLGRKHPDYPIARFIERVVPPGGKVLALSGVPESYTTRQVWIVFQSARGEVLGDIFDAAYRRDVQPWCGERLTFARREIRGLRIVQTAQAAGDLQWSISELRLSSGGRELPRLADWRLAARPNPWDVQLAFDNSPVTRWRSWQPLEPGMFVEVDFGKPRQVDEVELEGPDDCKAYSERVDVLMPDGRWNTIPSTRQTRTLDPPKFMGKASIREMKLRGVDFLFVRDNDYGAPEIIENPAAWGLTEAGRSDHEYLYRLDAGYPEMQK